MHNEIIIFGAKYLLLVLAGLALVWFLIQPKNKHKDIILFAIVYLPIIYAVAKLLSLFYYHTQPFVVGHFTPLIPHESDNTFPSEHTLLGAGIATIIFPFHKKLSLIAWGLTFLIGISRVLAGVHYPVDIVGSVIIAAFVGFLIYHVLFKRLNQRRSKNF